MKILWGGGQKYFGKNPVRVVVGKRGFIPSQNPKDKILKVKVTTETKEFVEAYCALWQITMSEFILRSIECYSGFNGKTATSWFTHEDILPMEVVIGNLTELGFKKEGGHVLTFSFFVTPIDFINDLQGVGFIK